MDDYVNLKPSRKNRSQQKASGPIITFLLGVSLTLNYVMLKELEPSPIISAEQEYGERPDESIADIGCIAELTKDLASPPQNFLCSLRGEHLKILSTITSIKFTEPDITVGSPFHVMHSPSKDNSDGQQEYSDGVLCINPALHNDRGSSVLCTISMSHIKALAQQNYTIELFKFEQ